MQLVLILIDNTLMSPYLPACMLLTSLSLSWCVDYCCENLLNRIYALDECVPICVLVSFFWSCSCFIPLFLLFFFRSCCFQILLFLIPVRSNRILFGDDSAYWMNLGFRRSNCLIAYWTNCLIAYWIWISGIDWLMNNLLS